MWSFRAGRPLVLLLCGSAFLATSPSPVAGQSARSAVLLGRTPEPLAEAPFQESQPVGQGRAFISSLVLPGLGQYQQGQRRWILYAGIEAVSAFLYFDRRSDGRAFRAEYRDFAWDVGRTPASGAPRIDGDFRYFETLSKWSRSGNWDRDLGTPGLQPETDPSTFNGSIWALAAEIFDLAPGDPAGSPGFQAALEYYGERGYGPEFLWDWTGVPGAQEAFGDLIQESDRHFRGARQAVGILLANHLLSALDGLISARLAALPQLGTELEIKVPLGPF